jgi:phytoene dehydrogenase-like protein
MTTQPSHVDVLVIGGGLAGLAAAATASAAGARRSVVLEAHDLGGRARTTSRDGFTFNLGAHALYVGGEAMATLRRLGVQPKGSPPPLDQYKLRMDGALHRMPSGPTSLLATTALTARSKAKLAKLLGLLPRLDPHAHAGESVDEWIAAQELRADAARVLHALVRIGTYSDTHDDLSAEAAITQLQRGAKAGVLYLDGGWRQLIDGLAAQVEVRRGAGVEAIVDEGTVRLTDGATITAGAIVLAAGPPAACRTLLPTTPTWRDLGEPATAACLDVAVRGIASPGYVLGVDDPVYGTTQSPPARQAPDGDSVVSVIRYGARNADDDRAQLQGWLDHVGVRPAAIVHDRFLARMVVAGTQPRAVNGGLAGRPAITDTGVPNVFLAGDWVGPDGMLADASLASGHAAGLAAASAAAARRATMVS